jgi:hypothetical protein
MALRRSNRLATKLHGRYLDDYLNIKQIIQTIGSTCVGPFSNSVTPDYKINSIITLANLMRRNFAFCLKYEFGFTQNRHVERFGEMLYKKFFEWIKEAITLDHIYLVRLKNTAKKFRKTYEKIRYANWVFLKSQFKLDDNVMFLINSYMHCFAKI